MLAGPYERKPALGMYAPTLEDSLYVSPEFSPALLTVNIAKR